MVKEYTVEEIEGIENLCRFLSKHQNELHTISSLIIFVNSVNRLIIFFILDK